MFPRTETVLQMWPQKCCIKWNNHFPQSDGYVVCQCSPVRCAPSAKYALAANLTEKMWNTRTRDFGRLYSIFQRRFGVCYEAKTAVQNNPQKANQQTSNPRVPEMCCRGREQTTFSSSSPIFWDTLITASKQGQKSFVPRRCFSCPKTWGFLMVFTWMD